MRYFWKAQGEIQYRLRLSFIAWDLGPRHTNNIELLILDKNAVFFKHEKI